MFLIFWANKINKCKINQSSNQVEGINLFLTYWHDEVSKSGRDCVNNILSEWIYMRVQDHSVYDKTEPTQKWVNAASVRFEWISLTIQRILSGIHPELSQIDRSFVYSFLSSSVLTKTD